jgi:predicted nucleotidyltransferase
MALFGSVLRDDFGPNSDIDVLVTLEPDAALDLFDLAELQEAMEAVFHRPVDIIEKAALRNPFRKNHILQTMEVIYAA